MYKQISIFLYGLATVDAVVGLVLWFKLRFVRSVDAATGLYYDGFGRQLELKPLIVRLYGADSLWAGWKYFRHDLGAFLLFIIVGFALIWYGRILYEKQSDN